MVVRDFSFGMLRRFVTYAFVHGSFTHAIFAGVLLLALGKFVGEVLGEVAVLVVFLVATVGGRRSLACSWRGMRLSTGPIRGFMG